MMVSRITASELETSVRSLISVTSSNFGLEVELPLAYPNGDTVVVTVANENEEFVVHDSGNGASVIAAHGINLTPKLTTKLANIASHYGCEFVHARMVKRVRFEDLAVAVAIVANASRSIGDQILSARHGPIVDFRTEALEVLRCSVGAKRVRENEQLIGESGSKYSASAIILDSLGSRPISIVEPIKDHDAATKKFREFWDISENHDLSHLGRISLYDDRRNWASSDLAILQKVSNIVRMTDGAARMRELAN